MTQRTTIRHLEALCDTINALTGSPKEPYDMSGERPRANVGNYHLDQAYGGVALARMSNEGGGISRPLGHGYYTKRELADQLRAFIRGLESEQN